MQGSSATRDGPHSIAGLINHLKCPIYVGCESGAHLLGLTQRWFKERFAESNLVNQVVERDRLVSRNTASNINRKRATWAGKDGLCFCGSKQNVRTVWPLAGVDDVVC